MKIISTAVWAVLVGMMMAGCSEAPVITLKNRSPVELTNIVISGAGFLQHIVRLAPGADYQFTIYPDEQTGIRLAFGAEGKRVVAPETGYVRARGGYRVDVVVETTLTTSVTSHLRPY
jgi:hypothetical protein